LHLLKRFSKIWDTLRKSALVVLLGVLAISLQVGCGSGSKVELDADYMKTAEQQGKEKRAIFERSNRNFDSMSAADREKYLSFFPNEEDAKRFWDLMSNPPGTESAPPVGTTTGN
jgi:hypothetical protein